jgi:S1-C subfamily serine protease
MRTLLAALSLGLTTLLWTGASAADDLEHVRLELMRGLSPNVLKQPVAEPPLTLRGPRQLAATIYKERVGGVVVVAIKDTIAAGTLVSSSGDIVTSDHALRDVHRAQNGEWVLAWFKPRQAPPASDDFLLGRVVLRDPQRDLALVRLVRIIPPNVTVVPIASATPEIGEDVFTIGHPKQHLWTLSQGIVTQLHRDYEWTGRDGTPRSARAIQTQAPVAAGSSGGPLLDGQGRLVGVVCAESGPSIHLAVQAHHVRELLAKSRAAFIPTR